MSIYAMDRASATVTLYFAEERKSYGVETFDDARAYAVEKGVLFFAYRRFGSGQPERFFVRNSLVSDWRRVGPAEFDGLLGARRRTCGVPRTYLPERKMLLDSCDCDEYEPGAS